MRREAPAAAAGKYVEQSAIPNGDQTIAALSARRTIGFAQKPARETQVSLPGHLPNFTKARASPRLGRGRSTLLLRVAGARERQRRDQTRRRCLDRGTRHAAQPRNARS